MFDKHEVEISRAISYFATVDLFAVFRSLFGSMVFLGKISSLGWGLEGLFLSEYFNS